MCIDIGASYFHHSNWRVHLFYQKIQLEVTVDPNVERINYITNWKYPSKIVAIGEALSSDGKDYNLNIQAQTLVRVY